MNRRAQTTVVWTLCLLMLAGSGTGVAWILRKYVHELSYRPVEAEITYAGVIDGAGRGLNYRPQIEYRFTYDGRPYRGSKYSSAHFARESPTAPQRIADRYPPGSIVTAWVDPSDPNQAVLVREPHWPLLIVFSVVSLIPIGLLVAHYRMNRKPLGSA